MLVCENCGDEVIEHQKGKVFIGFCTKCGIWTKPTMLSDVKKELDKISVEVSKKDSEK